MLKPGIGSNAERVVIGREVDAAVWYEAIEIAAAAGDSVVQRFIPAQTWRLTVLSDAVAVLEAVEVAPLLSALRFGRRFGGVYARSFANGATGIISLLDHFAPDTVAATR